MPISADAIKTLEQVTTATITTILLKKGLRNIWLRGPMPLRAPERRIVGPVFTLRFVPAREDLATPASWANPISTRAAIEDMPEGCIAVADAMGVTDAGIFGDILCARMKKRNVAALVTDGVVRDLAGVESTNLPVWSRGAAAWSSTNLPVWFTRRCCAALGRRPHFRGLAGTDRLWRSRRHAQRYPRPRPRWRLSSSPRAFCLKFSPKRRSRSRWRLGSCARSTAALLYPVSTR